ncbi:MULTISPECIES: hypothetical protein [unclassified Saccharopolyspora]|uniref:hypothetical protein n=1 Tax=Saccharopolyspora TaxID=1835 RepID=UPI001909FC36|nr:hypothetical protein [Saccharopolyspora sp. HNM0986]MBK0867227.1 hypothetical protein [Saccharopolyspora sp. HNM0986]
MFAALQAVFSDVRPYCDQVFQDSQASCERQQPMRGRAGATANRGRDSQFSIQSVTRGFDSCYSDQGLPRMAPEMRFMSPGL